MIVDLLLLAALIVIYIVDLPAIFQGVMHLPDAARVGLSIVLIAPLAFLAAQAESRRSRTSFSNGSVVPRCQPAF